jgi:lysophospholipase L1-like esterase
MPCALASGAESLRLVALADSTVAPRAKTRVYTDILREELAPAEVLNAGVPGNTSADLLKRLARDVLAHQPQVVLIQVGINDSAIDVWRNPPATHPRVPPDAFRANLLQIIASIRSTGARILLVAPNPLLWTPTLKNVYGKTPYDPSDPDGMDRPLEAYRTLLREIAQSEKIPLLDASAAFREEARRTHQKLEAFVPDGMHPGDAGHRVLASLIRKGLADLAAGGSPELAPLRTTPDKKSPEP